MSTGPDPDAGPDELARWVGDLAQIASTRLVTLEDGPERGGRAILAQSGGGLAATVLVDRALDIGALDWRGLPLAWQSPNGWRQGALIDHESEGFRGFERGFGGFLVTCGLDHIRQPTGGQPLHGRLPFTPARLEHHGVDWDQARPELVIAGEVVQARLGHEHLRLARRVTIPVGGSTLALTDTVGNRAPRPWPQALLYHINFGFPFLRPGMELRLDGERLDFGIGPPDPDGGPQVRCLPLAPGRHEVTLRQPNDGVRFSLGFDAATLPFLQLWRDDRPGTWALALEPCTSPRAPDGTSLSDEGLPPLAPGEDRRFELQFDLA